MEILVVWFVMAILVGIIGGSRGRSGFGWFLLAIILSPLIAGILVLILGNLDDKIERETRLQNSRECPYCAEPVLRQAKVCKHCGADLAPVVIQHENGLPAQASSDRLSSGGIAFITVAVVVAVGAALYFGRQPEPKPMSSAAPETTSVDHPITAARSLVTIPMPKARPK